MELKHVYSEFSEPQGRLRSKRFSAVLLCFWSDLCVFELFCFWKDKRTDTMCEINDHFYSAVAWKFNIFNRCKNLKPYNSSKYANFGFCHSQFLFLFFAKSCLGFCLRKIRNLAKKEGSRQVAYDATAERPFVCFFPKKDGWSAQRPNFKNTCTKIYKCGNIVLYIIALYSSNTNCFIFF